MLYHIICDLVPFNVIVWYNSYFHMLYHIFHNVIPLFLTVHPYNSVERTSDLYSLHFILKTISLLLQIFSNFTITDVAVASLIQISFFDFASSDNVK